MKSEPDNISLHQLDGWHVALCCLPELASQGNTPEEALENLREAFALQQECPVSTEEPTALFAVSVIEKLTFRQIRFKLENAGFVEVRQKGNHAKFVKRDGAAIYTAILPHYTEIATAVLASVVRQSGLEWHEFLEVL